MEKNTFIMGDFAVKDSSINLMQKYNIIRVASFSKVPLEQFKEDLIECMPEYNGKDNLIEEIYNDIKIPTRSTMGSAGYDFFAPFEFLPKYDVGIKIPTGIRCEIAEGWVLQLYPRSGQGFKYGLHLFNTVGIIDQDYFYSDNSGHIIIKVACRENGCIVQKGQAFCQGIFTPFGITRDDNVTDSRNGGFGSTDK